MKMIPKSYATLCRNFRVRLKDRIVHPNTAGYWPQCLAVDRMSRPELLELQQGRLRELMQHAIQHVPFYRQWAQEGGYTPRNPPPLNVWPIATKQMIRGNPDAFQSDAFSLREMSMQKTSGSSGEPFQFRVHRSATDYSYACLWRALSRHGLRPGDRRVYIWGRSYLFNSTTVQIHKTRLRQKLRNWLNNTLAVNAYDLRQHNVDETIDAIEEFRPIYLHGYVSALYTIARRMVETNRKFRNFTLLATVTESEKLYDFQREAMQQAFGGKILEHYGSVELGNIAQPDPEGYMRIAEDLYQLETQKSGEVLVTNLLAFAYPFIRFRLGDLVEIADPPNDRLPYSVVTNVVGRTVDLIPIKAGGYVHGVALAHVIDPHLRFVKKYQVHQLTLDHFTVKLIADGEMPDIVPQQIITDLRLLVGANTRVDVERVNEIFPAPSGKFRWVISNISDVAERALAESRDRTKTV